MSKKKETKKVDENITKEIPNIASDETEISTADQTAAFTSKSTSKNTNMENLKKSKYYT